MSQGTNERAATCKTLDRAANSASADKSPSWRSTVFADRGCGRCIVRDIVDIFHYRISAHGECICTNSSLFPAMLFHVPSSYLIMTIVHIDADVRHAIVFSMPLFKSMCVRHLQCPPSFPPPIYQPLCIEQQHQRNAACPSNATHT